ncbi:phosphonate ABC transporter, permease protein PhnE [Halalkalibacter sp. APA_J-10(15)]|uniref:phosphonate ABC transporter, permease protein PhnE n=1 Tax=Halalkalibacter sp. APA_J-10(15) TaxID=2933805 RepID=UPI001FF4B8DF|nr:phosphonate ABC transporter, permease protein PhnE [Halalkalibacter sp. APA_J-10(15)]MCK0471825.1 phosphonate ABC transporter, permease protein PhnE [Halalkalibacter sp. APA_J-10(15)]
MYDKVFPPKKMQLPNGRVVKEKRSRVPLIILLVLVAVVISIEATQFDIRVLWRRWSEFFVIIGQMIPPNWGYVPHLWGALMDTIKMSFLGSFLGSIVAVPVAILAASNMMKRGWLAALMKVLLSILRTLPTLVSALIATFIFGLGTLAGTVAIFLFTVAYVGKLLYEQIETVDMGAFEAMESIGHNRIQAFRYAIFPQVLPNYLSTSLFCFEGNVRYAAILGYVGAGGIGLLLNEGLGWRDYSSVGMILLMLAITVYVIESISEHFRKKLL